MLAEHLPATPAVESGGGGRHFYFALPADDRIEKITGLLPGVDLLAEASVVTAPPSRHASGVPYRWCPSRGLGEVPLAPLPPIACALIGVHREQRRAVVRP